MNTSHPTAALRSAADAIVQSKRLFVLSGAGLSKASGIPTYRDSDGLWETGDNLKYSHIDAFREDPQAFHKFWSARRREMGHVSPNVAHHSLRELQALKDATLATQNVDGLLTRAGCTDVLELHGNLNRSFCEKCSTKGRPSLLGRCLKCFSRVRPDVVLFGESLCPHVLTTAKLAASQCDLMLVVGTSAVVYPAAELPAIALKFGASLVVIDVELPLLARAADIALQGKAEVLLPELVERVAVAVESERLLKNLTKRPRGNQYRCFRGRRQNLVE